MTSPTPASILRTSLTSFHDAPQTQEIRSFERLRPRPRVLTLSRRPRRAKYPRQKTRGQRKSRKPDEVVSELDLSDGDAKRRIAVNNDVPVDGITCIAESLAISGSKRHHEMMNGDENTGRVETTSTSNTPTTNRFSNYTKFRPRVGITKSKQYSSNASDESASNLAHGALDSSRRLEADNSLVEAIARSLAQQVYLSSIKHHRMFDYRNHQNLEKQFLDHSRCPSQASSQRQSLNDFAQKIEKCAGNIKAKEKPEALAPTPAWSDATIRTISALLPFRSEFEAAGLAVTSKDQARAHSPCGIYNVVGRTRTLDSRHPIKQAKFGQLDGQGGNLDSGTEATSMQNAISRRKDITINDTTFHQEKQPLENKSGQDQCLPCVSDQIHRSDTWGCLQLMQKSQPRLLTSKPTTKGQDVSADIESKMNKTYTKSPAPDWANLTPPHILYPDHYQQTVNNKYKGILGQVMQGKLNKDASFPSFFSGLPRAVSLSDFHQHPTVSTGQGQRTGSPQSEHFLGEHSPLRHRNRAVKLAGGPSKSFHLAHSFKDLRQQSLMHISPKRYQSMPTHKSYEDLRTIAAKTKSLSDLLSTPKNTTENEHNEEWTIELATGSFLEGKGSRNVTKLPARKHSPDFQQHKLSQQAGLSRQGSSSKNLGRPNIPQRISSAKANVLFLNQGPDESGIMDRDVLRGLRIAVAAACDEKIDAFISAKTGLQIRRFLADLVLFEHLGHDTGEQRARRRAEIKNVKRRVRRARQMEEVGLAVS